MPLYEQRETGEVCAQVIDFKACYDQEIPYDTCSITVEDPTDCWMEYENVLTGYRPARDLGAMITLQTEALTALKEENELIKTELCKYHAYPWC